MRKLTAVSVLIVLTASLLAQNKLPNIQVKGIDGKLVELRDIQKEGKPMVLNFWATWCKPCVKELNAIRDIYPDWLDEADFQFVAISVDDSRSQHNVGPFVKGRGWEYEVFIDVNSELKRALNVVNIPHTFLLDKDGKIVWQHSGYSTGDEDILFEKILEFSK
jgi:peroxiredoxin